MTEFIKFNLTLTTAKAIELKPNFENFKMIKY